MKTAKFCVALFGSTVICILVWDRFVADHLYNCTDTDFRWMDYFFPGGWVHHPVSVSQIRPSRNMSEPDTIKDGWTITRLWCLWFAMVGGSLIGAALVASRGFEQGSKGVCSEKHEEPGLA